MNNYFIILASGQSKRFNSKKPKQFNIYKNKPLFEHSIDKALKSKLFKKIILVISNNCKFLLDNSIKPLSIKVKKVRKPTDSVIINKNIKYMFFLIKSIIFKNGHLINE